MAAWTSVGLIAPSLSASKRLTGSVTAAWVTVSVVAVIVLPEPWPSAYMAVARRCWPTSAGSIGVYLAEVAPVMSVKVPCMVMDLDHCHVTLPAVTMSGSVRVAVTSMPTTGCAGVRVAVPSSSTLVTVTVTSFMAILPPASALMVTM